MARPSSFNLRLQSLVLLILIPGLLLAISLFGWSIYRGLYGIIMSGFDQKLFAVATVTGSFIDGEEHEQLFRVRDVTALTADPRTDGLFGIDRLSGRLVHIDTDQGGALDAVDLPADSRALALEPSTGHLWVATSEPALYRLNPASGASERVASLSIVPEGLEYDPRMMMLYAGGDELFAIDPGTGQAHPMSVAGMTGPVRALALDPDANTLYLLHGEGEALMAVDLFMARAITVGELYDPEPLDEESRLFRSGPPPSIRDLAFNNGELVAAADRLVRIDAQTAAVDSTGTATGFRSSRDAAYQRYVAPMRRIMEKNDITYLYTETVELGGRLTYGIDATEGEDHSIIGTAEAISDEEIPAMERAMVEGTVRLSDLEDWGDWGLLKTADAPIYRNDGKVVALASADVDISVILERTRVALVKVGIVAALMLLVGALVSLFISRRLVSPLTEVKEGALQLAAGRYGHRIADQELLELRELSESFNSMSDALSTTISELSKTNLALETVRRRRALEVALADPGFQPDPGIPFLVERSEVHDGGAHDPSGYVHLPGKNGDRLVIWLIGTRPGSALESLRLRGEIAALTKPIMTRRRDDWSGAAALLTAIFPQIDAFILMDGQTRTVHAQARNIVQMAVVGEDGLIREIDLTAVPNYTVGPQEWVVVAAEDPLAAAEAIRRERIVPALGGGGVRGGIARRRSGSSRLSQMAIALFGRDVPIQLPEASAPPLPAVLAEVLER